MPEGGNDCYLILFSTLPSAQQPQMVEQQGQANLHCLQMHDNEEILPRAKQNSDTSLYFYFSQ